MQEPMIAAQLYTLRNFLKTPEEIEASLRKVKEIGYQAVQVSGMGPIEPVRLKEIVDDLGLTICATHIPFDRLQSDLDGVIETHRLWGCTYVGVGMMPDAYNHGREGYRSFVRDFSDIGRKLEAGGLHLVYHNHNFEFEKFDGTPGMQWLLDGASPQTYTLEIDTYWVQAGGGNPTEWIEKANGLLKVIHLKDMAVDGWKSVFAEVGQGNLNWKSIIDACRRSGVEWYVVEQDECRRDPFESLAISLEYLRQFV